MTAQPVLELEQRDRVAIVALNRPEKRNALNLPLVDALREFFASPPDGIGAVVLHGAGEHFCAGLDLAERLASPKKAAVDGMRHSQRWHRSFERIQFGDVPVVSVLKGAVIGGGLELAASTHVRVAERSAFFQLPEAQRGVFVGGGGSVRIARIIGVGRMIEMMLTARRYDADDGLRLGLAHYVVEPGAGLERAIELATQIASNAPISNFAIINAIARINDMSISDGLFTESVVAALSRTSGEAEERIASFLKKAKPRSP
ncbi:MAG TPA: crotonase/enoyl-CoA hydratase family protein [Burkholderiaceae bacterium]|nr:crotonase/enoyl-CoA hydratase family protein [Burkholderiaceae bacterium]